MTSQATDLGSLFARDASKARKKSKDEVKIDDYQSKLKKLNVDDITQQCHMITNSGVSGDGYEFYHIFVDNEDAYWSPPSTATANITFDCGRGNTINAVLVRYKPQYAAKTFSVLTSNNADTSQWRLIESVTTAAASEEQIICLAGKSDQFLKLEFATNKGYLGVEFLQILGKIGKIDATRYLASKTSDSSDTSAAAAASETTKTTSNKAQNVGNSSGASSGAVSDITASGKVVYVGDSGMCSGYSIDYAYSNDDWYWCSDGNHTSNCWIVFDVSNCAIDTIELKQNDSYYAGKLTVFTSGSTSDGSGDAGWSLITQSSNKSGQYVKLSIGGKNGRWIKIKFDDINYYATIQGLRWMGSTSGGAGTSLASAAGAATEVSNDIDISQIVKYIGNSGEYSGYTIDYAFSDDSWYWCSDGSHLDNCFVIFDVTGYKVSKIKIKGGSGYYSKTIAILTSDQFKDLSSESKAGWKEIGVKNGVGDNSQASFDIAGKNGNFIKISFRDIQYCATIEKLVIMGSQANAPAAAAAGTESKTNEETDEKQQSSAVAAQQLSFGKGGELSIVGGTGDNPGYPRHNMLDSEDTYWVPASKENPCLIIDCRGYEIDSVEMEFIDHKHVCMSLEFGLADVSNDYVFDKQGHVKSFPFEYTVARYAEELVKKLDIGSLRLYEKSYHPFIRLMFKDVKWAELGVKVLKITGHKTAHVYEPDEDGIELKMAETQESTSYGKIDIVGCSETFEGAMYVKENMLLDNPQHWLTYDNGKDAFVMFDLAKYAPNIKKVLIELKPQYECETINFYTSDEKIKLNSTKWTKISTMTHMHLSAGPQECKVGKGLKKYLLLTFHRLHNHLGVNRIKFISEFDYDRLDEDYNISLQDVLSTRRKDEDGKVYNDDIDSSYVSKYLNRLQQQRNFEMLRGYSEVAVIEQTEGILSSSWVDKMYQVLCIPYVYLYNQYIARSKLMKTSFEESETVKVANDILSHCKPDVEAELSKRINSCKKCIEYQKEAMEHKFAFYNELVYNSNNTSKILSHRSKFYRAQRDYTYEVKFQGSKSYVDVLLHEPEKLNEQMNNLVRRIRSQDKNIQQQDDTRNRQIFDSWCQSVATNPKELWGEKYGVEQYRTALKWAWNWDNMARHQKNDVYHKLVQHINILCDLLDDALNKKEINMHKFHLFTLSEVYDWARPKDEIFGSKDALSPKEIVSKKICDIICDVLNKVAQGEPLGKLKDFCKFLLCWQNPKYYREMMVTGKKLMKILRKDLDLYYTQLQQTQVQHKDDASKFSIIELKYKDAMLIRGQKVDTNALLLEKTFQDWYKPRQALYYPKDLKSVEKKWRKQYGFEFEPEFADIRRDNTFSRDKQKKYIVASDDLIFTFLNCVASKLDASFQEKIKSAFAENRKRLGKPLVDPKNGEIKVHTTPVKGKARQNVKMKIKYWKAKDPRCMAVTDIVRCGVVCEDEQELCSMFNLLVSDEKYFKGRVMRVKNAFSSLEKGNDSYGYRAVLMNLAHGDASVLKPYPDFQIACEVQLLLNSYWQVRGSMHLAYNIVRSETLNKYDTAEDRLPHYILAQDSCKFGTLDSELEKLKKERHKKAKGKH